MIQPGRIIYVWPINDSNENFIEEFTLPRTKESVLSPAGKPQSKQSYQHHKLPNYIGKSILNAPCCQNRYITKIGEMFIATVPLISK